MTGSPVLLAALAGVLGLCFGSFANVVILRLPKMLEGIWRREARTTLGLQPETEAAINLWRPGSRCPHCGAPIKARHNIPLCGWLWLRGRAACCGKPISPQYPLVELICAAMFAASAWRFGAAPQLPAALAFGWMLLVLTAIDLRTQLLPDTLTLPLLWLGLLLSSARLFVAPGAAIVGAAVGYGLLWLVFHGYRLATGKDGMGHGDFKLLAALGAWLGAAQLPLLLLLASAAGALVGVGLILLRGHDRRVPIAFGPYLAAAGWLLLLYGAPLSRLTAAL
ncbi:MAG: prepilin peptidase [Gammaproteobacteria bacterium]|nr:prepilin peptidase [Gammaproteobacteria bacterium]